MFLVAELTWHGIFHIADFNFILRNIAALQKIYDGSFFQ
jgi:hypothetical protein